MSTPLIQQPETLEDTNGSETSLWLFNSQLPKQSRTPKDITVITQTTPLREGYKKNLQNVKPHLKNHKNISDFTLQAKMFS